MENTIDFLFTALHKKEKYLHLSEVTRGSFQFDRSLSIPSQAAGLVRTILREQRPDFRYAGQIEDEIQQALYVSKPSELNVLKIIFKITGSPVYDQLKDLPNSTVTTLGGSSTRQVCLSKNRIRAQNRLTLRCPESCITAIMIRSALMFRLLKYKIDVVACTRQDKTNLYRISLSGEHPPYDLVANPKLVVHGVELCLNFDKHPLTCDHCFDVHHTAQDCEVRPRFCRQCRQHHGRGIDCQKLCSECGASGHTERNCPRSPCTRCFNTTHTHADCTVEEANLHAVREDNLQTDSDNDEPKADPPPPPPLRCVPPVTP